MISSCWHEKLFALMWTHLSDMWLSPLEIDTVQLRPVAEIEPKSPFLCVKRSPIRERCIQLWLDPSASQRPIPCSGPPTMYQDLSTRPGWPVKKSHCRFANQVEAANSKRTFGNSLSPLRAQNKDLSAAWQTLLFGVWLRMGRRLDTDWTHQVHKSCYWHLPNRSVHAH